MRRAIASAVSIAAWWLVTSCAICHAAAPRAVITGPTTGNPGDLVKLTAAESIGEAFVWRSTLPAARYDVADDQRKLIFATGTAGTYTFWLIAAAKDCPDGKLLIDDTEHVVTIGQPPEPGPGPTPPGPNPEPLPPGRFGLAAVARDAATGVPLAAAERQRTAQALAGNFEALASAIAAGVVKDLADLQAKTQAGNRAALGAAADAWRSWAAQLKSKLGALDGVELKTLADFADAWREIAAGLRAVR